MKKNYVGLFLSLALSTQGHPGWTDAEGCHADKLPCYCHGDAQSDHPSQTRSETPTSENSRSSARNSTSEDEYNRRFCASVGGVTETHHTYTYDGGSSYVKVDCETDTTVYEGGLDSLGTVFQ